MAKTLITGGQGFLGKNLTQHLLDRGDEVCSTYSYTLPTRSASSQLNFFRLNVTSFDDCLKVINQEQPEVIYHLVAQPLVTAAQRHPFLTMELTIRGAYNLLEAVRQSGRTDTRVIVYTTDKVYGENSNARETDRLDTTIGPYDTAKVCEDLIARMYAESFGLNVITARSANLYGRGDLHWDRLIPYACRELIHNRSPQLRSNGLLLRDYIYIDDILDGLTLMSDAFASGELLSGESINFGAETPNTPIQIVDMLTDICEKNIEPEILDNAVGELSCQHINYDKAKTLLGWQPKTPIYKGLEKTYYWYSNWFSK